MQHTIQLQGNNRYYRKLQHY